MSAKRAGIPPTRESSTREAQAVDASNVIKKRPKLYREIPPEGKIYVCVRGGE